MCQKPAHVEDMFPDVALAIINAAAYSANDMTRLSQLRPPTATPSRASLSGPGSTILAELALFALPEDAARPEAGRILPSSPIWFCGPATLINGEPSSAAAGFGRVPCRRSVSKPGTAHAGLDNCLPSD